ncbi:hypothetical protein JPSP40_24410 [Staphylococcus pseudintermedius]
MPLINLILKILKPILVNTNGLGYGGVSQVYVKKVKQQNNKELYEMAKYVEIVII